MVGHRLTAQGPDLVDHGVGCARLDLAPERPAEVVDHEPHPLPRELEGVAAPETLPRAGDEGDLAVQSLEHARPPSADARPQRHHATKWNTF